MGNPDDTSLIEALLGAAPIILFAAALSLATTGWLLVSRIKGCFRPRRPTPTRDLAFLLTPPVSALLTSGGMAAVGASTMLHGGIDVDWAYAALLGQVASLCFGALFCFAIGLIALALPAKPDTAPASEA